MPYPIKANNKGVIQAGQCKGVRQNMASEVNVATLSFGNIAQYIKSPEVSELGITSLSPTSLQ